MLWRTRQLAVLVAVSSLFACKAYEGTRLGVPVIEVGDPATLYGNGSNVLVGRFLSTEKARELQKVALHNIGAGSLELVAIDQSGDADLVLEGLPTPGTSLPADGPDGKSVSQLKVTFTPHSQGTFKRQLRMTFNNSTVKTMSVTFYAEVTGGCANITTADLAFGTVAKLGDATQQTLTIQNWDTAAEARIRIGAIEGVDAASFGFVDAATKPDPSTTIAVPVAVKLSDTETKAGELTFALQFKPAYYGDHHATMTITSADSCKPTVVKLVGSSPDAGVVCEPTSTDTATSRVYCHLVFDTTAPGRHADSAIKLTNKTDKVMHITGAKIDPAGVFSVTTALPAALPNDTKPYDFIVRFQPQVAGPVSAVIALETDDELRPHIEVEVDGIGGGPIIALAGADNGTLAFDQVAADTWEYRTLVVKNTGSAGGTSNGKLKFGTVDANGFLTPKMPDVDNPTEFRIQWPPPDYNEEDGIAPGDEVAFFIQYKPRASATEANAKLTIYSNDANAPQTVVTLSGSGVSSLPCDAVVDPASAMLDFGTVTPTQTKDLSLTIRNRSATNACLIANLDFSHATKRTGAFQIVGDPIDKTLTLNPGGAVTRTVRFAPGLSGDFTGELSFYVSNPSNPSLRVQLKGKNDAGGKCLGVVPDPIDFIDIGSGCGSFTQTVTVYNVCAGSTYGVGAITISQSDAFKLDKLPTQLPVSLTPGTTFQFTVAYDKKASAPVDADLVLSSVTVDGVAADSVTVAVKGSNRQRDTYTQDSWPELDVLFVVDDGPEMASAGTYGAKLASLFDAMDGQSVDYHAAVTTTSVGPNDHNDGKLLNDAGVTFVTRDTPDAAGVFGRLADVGNSGNAAPQLVEPAKLALSEPLLSGLNAGFRRPEADLSVVVVSNANDASKTTSSQYDAFFAGLFSHPILGQWRVSGAVPRMTAGPTGGACHYASQSTTSDNLVTVLAQLSGGVSADVCSDWTSALAPAVTRPYTPKTEFFLKAKALETGMTVTVDGLAVSTPTDWTYNATDRAVVFAPGAVPAPGAKVEISYSLDCN